MCFEGLNCGSTSPSSVSIFDPYIPPFSALVTLLQADKSFLKLFTSHARFLMPVAEWKLYEGTTNLGSLIPPQITQFLSMQGGAVPGALLLQHGKGAVQVEHNTLLGRLLRIAPDTTLADIRLRQHFQPCAKPQPRGFVEGKIKEVGVKCHILHSQCSSLLTNMLKLGGVHKDNALEWILQTLYVNAEAEKERPSPLVASSSGFAYNVGVVLLNLCAPFLNDSDKLFKVDFNLLLSQDIERVFSMQKLGVQALCSGEGASAVITTAVSQGDVKKWNFISLCYFMTVRALHQGIAQQCGKYRMLLQQLQRFANEIQTEGPRGMYFLTLKLVTDSMLMEPQALQLMIQYVLATCKLLLRTFASPAEQSASTTWVVSSEWMTPQQQSLLERMPMYLLEDALEIVLWISRTIPQALNTVSMEPLLDALVFWLRRPWAITSPHLRAKCGLVLASVFLPVQHRESLENYAPLPPTDGMQVVLLEQHRESQAFLAPALLLLYGDMEKTGFYEKLTNRQSIMFVLRYLWSLPSHRAAFRGIAIGDGATGDSSTDTQRNYFVRFANGLINETNALIASTLELLTAIRAAQLKQQNPVEMQAMNEEQRNDFQEMLMKNEQECKFKAGLCAQTLNMLTYLTSDDVIRGPFMSGEIFGRFVSMLLSLLVRLVGSKSVDIKVDNMEQYNFKPKEMLHDVCAALLHFIDTPLLVQTMANDGFYDDGSSLKKAIVTVTKLHLFPVEEVSRLQSLHQRVAAHVENIAKVNDILANAPDEFLDPLLSTFMKDPVILPSSRTVVDRTTIQQHLLNEETGTYSS